MNIPASDPFRLTPLLLAKLKMDNLRQSQHLIHQTDTIEWSSESAKNEYEDLKSVSIKISQESVYELTYIR